MKDEDENLAGQEIVTITDYARMKNEEKDKIKNTV